MSWREEARRVIAELHRDLPSDASLGERRRALDDAYPFGLRQFYPYKVWLSERRAYLCKFGYIPKGAPPMSPMERMMTNTPAHDDLARAGDAMAMEKASADRP